MAASNLVTSLETARSGRINSTLLHDSSFAKHRQTVDKIIQAHEFHELLDSSPVQGQDDNNNLGYSSERSLASSNVVEVDGGELIHVVKQRLFSKATGEGDNVVCPNAASRHGHWKKDPSFPFSHRGVGFLSQISHLCYRAQLRHCQNSLCRQMREGMDTDAPPCTSWSDFRDWALTAMSCQSAMRASHGGIRPPHTHIARAVAGCCMILRECLPSESSELPLRHAFHDYMSEAGDENGNEEEEGDRMKTPVNIHDVVEIIYWMATTQYHQGIGPSEFGHWGSKLLPNTVTFNGLNTAHDDLEGLKKYGFCKARVWGFVEVCDRKEADLIGIVAALEQNKEWLVHDKKPNKPKNLDEPEEPEALDEADDSNDPEKSKWRKHERCVANRCQTNHMNTSSIPPAHKCNKGNVAICCNLNDPAGKIGELRRAVVENTSTAWHFDKDDSGWLVPDRLSEPGEKYMAISHIWSDGTGGRFEDVNVCLFDYFARIAEQLGYAAIWWDAISVPSSGKEKDKALQTMNLKYSGASVTLVHDNYLLGINDIKPETRCLGIVLSGWYTRMWTAMELAKSKDVRVMFGGSKKPVLLNDILAKRPESCSRAHWMASSSIRRLREPVNDLGDLISVLRPRSTSKRLDRTIIALNLAEVPEALFGSPEEECNMTMQLLKYLGHIPQNCLLHGKPTINTKGSFSWCPGSLEDLPVPTTQTDMESREVGEVMSMLRVSNKGVVTGKWWCRDLAHNLVAYGADRPSTVKVELALHNPDNYILLRPATRGKEDAALLAMPLKVTSTHVHCRYIGAVKVVEHGANEPSVVGPETGWHLINISFGIDEGKIKPVANGRAALSKAHTLQTCQTCEPTPEDQLAPEEAEQIQPENHFRVLRSLSSLALTHPDRQPSGQAEEPTTDHLIQAVKTEREKAIQYLVSRGINLGEEDLERLSADKETICGLWALGSVYMTRSEQADAASQDDSPEDDSPEDDPAEGDPAEDDDQAENPPSQSLSDWDRAIMIFSKATKLCEEWDPKDGAGHSWLLPQLRLNYGRVLSATRPNDGEALARRALTACQMDRASRPLKERMNVDRLLYITNHVNIEGGKKQELYEFWDCTEEGWARLEWDCQGDLILRNAETYQYSEAASLYRSALVNILVHDKTDDDRRTYLEEVLAGNEVFDESEQRFKLSKHPRLLRPLEIHNDEGELEEIEEKFNKRSKRYENALKWFQNELSRDHLLVSLTRLHLGASLALEGRWADAEKHLRQALEDFKNRLTRNLQHAIIAFSQYHLGMAVGKLGVLEEAKALLTSSTNHFSGGAIEWMKEATQWALNEVAPGEAQPGEPLSEAPAPGMEEEEEEEEREDGEAQVEGQEE